MNEGHIVSAYDKDLRELDRLISEMGGLVESQLAAALDALVRLDPEAAEKVIARDKVVDDYEHQIDTYATEMLALRQPMAQDLRIVLVALKLSANLERMGDYAKNIAKRAVTLTRAPLLASATQSIKHMGEMVQDMISDVLDAYSNRNAGLANAVIQRDVDVDRMYTSLFRDFMETMAADPTQISLCTHLVFIAKNVERIGDHTTNVAEKVIYMLEGNVLEDDRPKDDMSTAILLEDDGGKGTS